VQEKRTKAITIRLTPGDMETLKKAGEALWPGAVLTQSGIVLGLARMMAESVLKKKPSART
jgi:hypothetical protein